ncbi:hypothetical protein JGU66_27945 [Myxococcaceae bacterium JPH2]|nr:hypothetical protein [Myxococcaceae bacterium JPH2]
MNHHLLWSTCAAAALALTACGKDDPPTTDECGEPLYAGKATDESWRALVDAKDKAADSSRAVTLLTPEPSQTFAASDPAPRFTWTSPLRASLERPGKTRPSTVGHPRASGPSFLARVANWVVPTAEAHLPPYTGDLYWVQVQLPGQKCPVAVLTSELEWQLDDTTWKTLRDVAGKDLTVQVTSAYLVQNRITEGPYQLATPVTFRVGMAK